MTAKRLGLVSLLACVVIAMGWFANRPGSHVEGLAQGGLTVGGASPAGIAPSPGTPVPAGGTERIPGAAPDAEPRAPEVLGEFLLEDALWIEGQVVLPEDLPEDEAAHVLVMASREDAGPLGLGSEPREGMARSLSRGPIGTAGSFRVPVPEGLDSVHLSVRGRYLYSEQATEVRVGAGEEIVLSPTLGAWVIGALQQDTRPGDSDGQAGASEFEARLSIHPESLGNMFDGSAWARRIVRGQEGRFQFEAVSVEEPIRVVAISDTMAAATSERIELFPGARVEVNLTPGPGGTVRGVVLDGEGEPFPGAEVFALDDANFLAGRTGRLVRETATDAEGRFELNGVAAGAMSIRARFPQHLVASQRVEFKPGETVEGLELVLTRGRTIAGRVIGADGAGRAGAEVTATFDVGKLGGIDALGAIRGNFQRAVSDEDGNFTLSGLGRGPFTVAANWIDGEPATPDVKPGQRQYRPDDFAQRAHTARAERIAPDGEELELELQAPLAIHGIVLLPGGLPATEFHVQVSRSGESLVEEFGKEVLHGDFESEEGTFHFWGLRPGTWTVVVRAPGCAPSEEVSVTLPQPANGPPLQIIVRAESRVSGRVLDPGGQPVSGARVELASNSLQRLSRVYHSLGEDHSVTDGKGAFELGGLSAGTVALVARARGWAESETVEVELLDGLPLDDVVLQLREGATLTGEVYNDQGTPAVGDAVVAQIPGAVDMIQTSTDPEGKFRFDDVYPGKWQVVAMPNEDRIAEVLADDGGGVGSLVAGMRMRIVELAEGAEAHVVLGEPLPDPVRVFGRVTLDNRGVSGVVVSFVGAVAQDGSVRFESADSQGNYEVLLPGAGSYLMLVQRMGEVMAETSLEFQVEIPDRPEHEIDVEIPLGRVSGQVEGPRGEALSGVRVTLVGAENSSQTFWGGHFTETETNERGEYQVDWLRPGTYRVTAGGVRYGGMFGSPSPWGKGEGQEVQLDEGEHVGDVDFRLEVGGSLAGVVRDAYGEPVPGAAIYAYDSRGQPVERLSFVTSDNSGSYEFDGLGPGEYTLLARSELLASERSEALFVQGGKVTEADLVMNPGTVLEVEVLDGKGQAVEANVRVVDRSGFEVSGAISFGQLVSAMQGGSAKTLRQIGPLAPGRYTVSAEVPGVGSAKRKKTLRGDPQQSMTLRLK